MAFTNEYVPPVEQESSEFFRQARKTLSVMAEMRSKWTVDREREMALVNEGSGRELESANHNLWSFLDRKGFYVFSTEQLSKIEVSPDEVAISRRLNGFWAGERYSQPDKDTLARIKEALREYNDWGVVSDYKRCQLTLIDSSGRLLGAADGDA